MSTQQISHVNIGDKTIKQSTLNSVIDFANKFNASSIDGATTVLQSDNGLNVQVVNKYQKEATHPFKILKLEPRVLRIKKGDWIRNQISVTLQGDDYDIDPDYLVVDIDSFTNNGVVEDLVEDVPYYGFALLEDDIATSTYRFDPALIPGKLTLHFDRNIDYVHKRTPDYLSLSSPIHIRELWIKNSAIIGNVILKLSQLQQGVGMHYISKINQTLSDDIIDNQIVCDSTPVTATIESRHRSSVIQNRVYGVNVGTETQHFGELQLVNINKCPGTDSCSTPFFFSAKTGNDVKGPAGELSWSTYDSHYYPQGSSVSLPFSNTLQINIDYNLANVPDEELPWQAVDNSFQMTSLYGVLDTYEYSKSMCYYDSLETDVHQGNNQTKGTLKWASIDTHLFSYVPSSLELKTTTTTPVGQGILQIYGFENAATVNSYSLTGDELILFKDPNNLKVQYLSTNNLLDYVDDNIGFDCSDVYNCIDCNFFSDMFSNCTIAGFNHTDLNDIVAGNYNDNDHRGYWHNGEITSGHAGAADLTYTNNYCSSIGNSSIEKVIDLNGAILQNTTGGVWNVAPDTKLLVNNLTDVTYSDPATGALQVKGGANISSTCQAAKFIINNKTGNYWNSTDFFVYTSNQAQIVSDIQSVLSSYGPSIIKSFNNKVRLEIPSNYLDIITPVGIQLNGVTQASLSDGTNDWFKFGLFKNGSSATIQTVLVPDGAGGTESKIGIFI